MAHELAHIGNRDMLLSTIVTVMVGIVVIYRIYGQERYFGAACGVIAEDPITAEAVHRLLLWL